MQRGVRVWALLFKNFSENCKIGTHLDSFLDISKKESYLVLFQRKFYLRLMNFFANSGNTNAAL